MGHCLAGPFRRGGASFAFVDEEAMPAEEDESATALTGGTFLLEFVVSETNSQVIDIKSADISIRPGETLTVAAIGSGALDDVVCSITYSSEV